LRLRSRLREAIYRAGSGALLLLLRVPILADALGLFAKVWLRHSRLAQHLRTHSYDQVLDGGANIGEFAALVRASRPCVEPHPGAARTLRGRGFEVVEVALWSEAGVAELRQPTEASTSATLVGPPGDGQERWTVKTARLDQLGLNGRSILIKLDLQGAEEAALEGMGELWNRVSGVLLEVSYGPEGSYERLRALLARNGFAEAATFNELESAGHVLEADKLWLRR
jgi:FkbM family methyltransferase